MFIDSIVPRLYVGRTAQLTAVVRDSAGALVTNRALAWTSSAPSFVTVSGTGLLAGVAPGGATITATLDGVSGARVVVAQAIPSALIALQPAFGSLARGVDYALAAAITDIDGKPLTGHSVTYATSDLTVATVSATGVVHPLANGFVTITGTVDGALPAAARLSVMDPRTVAGHVITADGGSPSNLVFVALTGIGPTAQRFLTTIDGATGTFSLHTQRPREPVHRVRRGRHRRRDADISSVVRQASDGVRAQHRTHPAHSARGGSRFGDVCRHALRRRAQRSVHAGVYDRH